MWTSCAEDALNQVEAGDAEARPTRRTIARARCTVHLPMLMNSGCLEAMKRNIAFTNKQLEFFSSDFGCFFFSWEKEPKELITWSQVLRHFFVFFFSKNWSEPIFLPQFSWGVETQSAFQCPRNFRSLGRILFGSSMSCFSGTVWNWCAWIWPSCSGFWWVPSLSWMSGISACQLDFIMGSKMEDLGRSVDHLKRTAKGWSDFFLFLTISWHMPGCQVHGISVLEQIEAAKCRPELYCIFGLLVGVWWHEPWVELLGTFEKGHLSIKKQISWLFFGGVKWSGPWMTLIGANSFAIIGQRKMPGGSLWVQGGAVCPWTWRIVRKPCRWKILLHITSWLCGFSLKRIYFE